MWFRNRECVWVKVSVETDRERERRERSVTKVTVLSSASSSSVRFFSTYCCFTRLISLGRVWVWGFMNQTGNYYPNRANSKPKRLPISTRLPLARDSILLLHLRLDWILFLCFLSSVTSSSFQLLNERKEQKKSFKDIKASLTKEKERKIWKHHIQYLNRDINKITKTNNDQFWVSGPSVDMTINSVIIRLTLADDHGHQTIFHTTCRNEGKF